ncbi:MAG TPA: DUF4375 domain-containing protein [Cyclobacteriaceae bacterium]
MKASIFLMIALCCFSCSEKKDFRTMNSAQLSALPDENLAFEIYDQVLTTIGEEGYSSIASALRSLTPGQRAICVAVGLDGEIQNGGFNQYYFNTTDYEAGLAEESFRLIGAAKYADIVKEANTIYSQIKGDLESKDDGTLESFSESYKDNPLNALDQKWYELSPAESLDSIMLKYIRANSKDFAKD